MYLEVESGANTGILDTNPASSFDGNYLTRRSLCGDRLVKFDNKRDETEQKW